MPSASDEPASPINKPSGIFGGLFSGGGGRGPAPRPQPVQATGVVATRPDGTRVPGARATFVALVLAGLGFLFLIAAPLVKVDDRGDAVPFEFEGLYLEARQLITGQPVEADTITLVQAQGGMVVLVIAMPLFMAGLAYWMHRKTGLSRPLTIGMLALAVGVFFLQGLGQYYIPALIALAVGSFQARKAELPARMAERVTRSEDKDDADELDDDDDEFGFEYDEDDELDEDKELDDDPEDRDGDAKR